MPFADDTHFSEHGARRTADMVLDGVAEPDRIESTEGSRRSVPERNVLTEI